MHLAVYSLKKILFQDDALAVNCKAVSGEITILDNHRPLISALVTGTIKIIDKEKKEHYIPISSGFVEINSQNQIRLIVQ